MDTVGANEEADGGRSTVLELKGDFGCRLRNDVGKFLSVCHRNGALVDHGAKLVEQDLTIDTNGLIIISALVAKGVQIRGFLVFVLEREFGEVVAFAADASVHSQRTKNSKGIG